MLFRDGYISSRSGHSRGSTVDLTLARAGGSELEMGTPFDFFSPRSWPPRSAHPDVTDCLPIARLLRERDQWRCGHGASETGDKLASSHAVAPQPDDRTLPN
jgi:hypothetical protein